MVCSPSENLCRIHIARLNLLVSSSAAAEVVLFQSKNLSRILESFVFCGCNMRLAQHTLSVDRAGSTIVHDPQSIRHRGTTRNLALVNADLPLKCLVLHVNTY